MKTFDIAQFDWNKDKNTLEGKASELIPGGYPECLCVIGHTKSVVFHKAARSSHALVYIPSTDTSVPNVVLYF